MPDGAIIVKENYGKDKKTLMAVTPMYKVKGYNPEGGDWFWVKYGAGGKILAAGQPKGCIECHGVQKSKDWFTVKNKRQPQSPMTLPSKVPSSLMKAAPSVTIPIPPKKESALDSKGFLKMKNCRIAANL